MEEYLKCGEYTDEEVECIIDVLESEDYDAYGLVVYPALELDQAGELDPSWTDNLEDLAKAMELIDDDVERKCFKRDLKQSWKGGRLFKL